MRAKEQRVSSVWKPLTKTQRKTVLCPVGVLDDLHIATVQVFAPFPISPFFVCFSHLNVSDQRHFNIRQR